MNNMRLPYWEKFEEGFLYRRPFLEYDQCFEPCLQMNKRYQHKENSCFINCIKKLGDMMMVLQKQDFEFRGKRNNYIADRFDEYTEYFANMIQEDFIGFRKVPRNYQELNITREEHNENIRKERIEYDKIWGKKWEQKIIQTMNCFI